MYLNFLLLQVWYELVQFGARQEDSVFDSNSRIVDVEEESKHLEVICDCGAEMRLNTPLILYGTRATYCSMCTKPILSNSFMYHCPNGKDTKHPRKGFCDFCANCGDIQAQKNKSEIKIDEEEEDVTVKTSNKANTTMAVRRPKLRDRVSGRPRKQEENHILFESLYGMANDRLLKQRLKLKETIDKLLNRASFKEMIRYQQANEDRIEANALRQDNGEYITFPNRLGFDIKKLEELNLKDFYNVNVYLSNLMIVANALNNKFHETMEIILKKDFSVTYQRGPLKRIERCIAKTESDYADKPVSFLPFHIFVFVLFFLS